MVEYHFTVKGEKKAAEAIITLAKHFFPRDIRMYYVGNQTFCICMWIADPDELDKINELLEGKL